VELAIEDGRDHCTGNDTSSRDADDNLWIVGARDLERERSRELAEQGPLDIEDTFRVFDGSSAGGHDEHSLMAVRADGAEIGCAVGLDSTGREKLALTAIPA
jgi:hypothetical protein